MWYPALPETDRYGIIVMGSTFHSVNDSQTQPKLLVEELLHVEFFTEDHASIANQLGIAISSGDSDKDIQQKIHNWLKNDCK